MTHADLIERLEAVAPTATPGPWSICIDATGDTFIASMTNSVETICEFGAMDTDESQEQLEADAALIVELRNNLPAILAALKAREVMT